MVGSRQRGMALVMSLVILMILTVLGITAMSTATLEEKMSGNTQESTRALEAAESGVNTALNTAGSLDPTYDCAKPAPLNALNVTALNSTAFSYGLGQSGAAAVTSCYIQDGPPKRGSGYSSKVVSADSGGAAFFAVVSTGSNRSAGAQARAVVEQGVAQIKAQ